MIGIKGVHRWIPKLSTSQNARDVLSREMQKTAAGITGVNLAVDYAGTPCVGVPWLYGYYCVESYVSVCGYAVFGGRE